MQTDFGALVAPINSLGSLAGANQPPGGAAGALAQGMVVPGSRLPACGLCKTRANFNTFVYIYIYIYTYIYICLCTYSQNLIFKGGILEIIQNLTNLLQNIAKITYQR